MCFAEETFSFTRPLEDRHTTKIPDVVTFECELSAADLEVEWCRNERPLKRGEKYEMSGRGTVHKLVISEVDDRDAGEYSVHFRKLVSQAKLTVEGTSSSQNSDTA